jgi:hypothetical protein
LYGFQEIQRPVGDGADAGGLAQVPAQAALLPAEAPPAQAPVHQQHLADRRVAFMWCLWFGLAVTFLFFVFFWA